MTAGKPISFLEERVAILWSDRYKKFVLVIPVRNDYGEYTEDYEITEEQYHYFSRPEGYGDLMKLAEECRGRRNDAKLLEKPGSQRGRPI